MGTQDVIVTLPFLGVNLGLAVSEAMDMLSWRLFIRVMNDTQANLPRVAPDRAHHGWPVIIIGAVAA